MTDNELKEIENQIEEHRISIALTAGRLEAVRDKMSTIWRNYHQLELEVLQCPLKVGVENG